MKIGTIDIANAIVLAPMEDVSDLPFRLVCKRLGADILYTEFVNSEGLVRNSEKTKRKMIFSEEERPFGIQIYGGEESSMEGAARMADEMNPDIVDINAGCWVKNVVLHGAGAGLLKDLPKMERIVSSVIKATNKPVTVKTRLGWDENSIRIVDVAKMVEGAGAQALTVHCRTREQGHKGDPDYSWIPKIKEAVKIPIMVNGNIFTPEDVHRTFAETGCDGVMVGRGAIENPWIFKQAKEFMQTGQVQTHVTVEERVRLCIEHLKLSVQYKGDRTGMFEMRKHYSGYLRGLPNVSKVRMELMGLTDIEAIVNRLLLFKDETLLLMEEKDVPAAV